MLIAPSLLSADFGNLAKDIKMLNNSKADWLHIDVMDGVFVPNISFGFPVIKYIKNLAKKPLDVHLMIVEPDKFIKKFKDFGADILTVHYEGCCHLHRTIYFIKESGIKAGVSVNPHTSVSLLQDIINEVDLILIMSVNPGFSGQKFISNTYNKVKQLRQLIAEHCKGKSAPLIEVDGGVNLDIAKKLAKCGVDVIVSGDFVFKSDNPKKIIDELKNC